MNWQQVMDRALEALKTSGAAAAEPLLRKALEIAGDTAEYQAMTHFNLGLVLYDLKKSQEAELSFARAIEIIQKGKGLLPKHNELYGMFLKTMTEFYEKESRFAESRQYFLLEIDLTREMYGPKHPYVANITCEYGQVLIKLKEYAVAEKNLKRALEIMTAARGVEHVQNGPIHRNLAKCYEALGQTQDAEYHKDRADEMEARAQRPKSRSDRFVD